jgi:hypothetical protein
MDSDAATPPLEFQEVRRIAITALFSDDVLFDKIVLKGGNSPEMIAIEKLRAICQQMPEYPLNRTASPRARDFYDIHLVVRKTGVNLASPENLEIAREIFAAKDVPLSLLAKILAQREFHRADWDNVKASTKGYLEGFDYYFDFVVRLTESMKPLWNE